MFDKVIASGKASWIKNVTTFTSDFIHEILIYGEV